MTWIRFCDEAKGPTAKLLCNYLKWTISLQIPLKANCLNSIPARFESETWNRKKEAIYGKKKFLVEPSTAERKPVQFPFAFHRHLQAAFSLFGEDFWNSCKMRRSAMHRARTWSESKGETVVEITELCLTFLIQSRFVRAHCAPIAGFTIYVSYGTECHHFHFSSACSIHRFARFSTSRILVFWGQTGGN